MACMGHMHAKGLQDSENATSRLALRVNINIDIHQTCTAVMRRLNIENFHEIRIKKGYCKMDL